MTKKNVGGSFTFEAYNSKEYTDGISFSINQDGQYKVNHVLDNKWGKVAVLATKDDLLSIDIKKYESGALSKGTQKEINLTFESRTGYTRRYFVGELLAIRQVYSYSGLVILCPISIDKFRFHQSNNTIPKLGLLILYKHW